MQIPKTRLIRLHGKALANLVNEVYKRDRGHCIICGRPVPMGTKPHHCPQGALKSDELGKMALLCNRCHDLAHTGHHGEVQRIKRAVMDYLGGGSDG